MWTREALQLARYLNSTELARLYEITNLGMRAVLSCQNCTLAVQEQSGVLVHAFNGKSLCREGAPYKAEHPRVVAK